MLMACALLPARRIPAGFNEEKRYTGEAGEAPKSHFHLLQEAVDTLDRQRNTPGLQRVQETAQNQK
jgi:hypothetical protein